jgi:AhpD family alkylhydroperoxidase
VGGLEKTHYARRLYTRPVDLIRDLWGLVRAAARVGRVMRGETISAAFRERLMLAVSAVNGCRHCSYAHARQALAAGVSSEEIERLSGGEFDGSPSREIPALLYAQHWAETDGHPEPATRERMIALYGDDEAGAIELALRVIRMGNLGGNTLDHVLYRLTRGRHGIDARTPAAARGAMAA